jgi:hypothetical protein
VQVIILLLSALIIDSSTIYVFMEKRVLLGSLLINLKNLEYLS